MKILVLTKRHYMAKDLINDRYGRFYEIPKLLSTHNTVKVFCINYRLKADAVENTSIIDGDTLEWSAFSFGQWFFKGIFLYLKKIDDTCKTFKPDLILACSDCFQIILGRWFSKKYNIPLFSDLYDNFESYGGSRIPGVIPLFKNALRGSSGITCVSQPLSSYVAYRYKIRANIMTLENAVPEGQFYPLSKEACRNRLNLPLNAKIIGTTGALYRNRGIDALYLSFLELSRKYDDLHLVLAGPYQPDLPPPRHSRIHYLGQYPSKEIFYVINALDIGVICNKNSDFGRYCFPQKLYEFVACKIPIICANTEVTIQLLQEYPQCLYEMHDHKSLSSAIIHQLSDPIVAKLDIPTWTGQATRLEHFLRKSL